MGKFKAILGLTITLFCFFAYSQPKLDREQNKRLEDIEKKINALKPSVGKNFDRDIAFLKGQIKTLQKKMADKPKVAAESINSEEIKEIDIEIEKNRKQLNALKKAIKDGLDQSLVKGQLEGLERSITSLKSKKFTILNTKISNQTPESDSTKKILSFEGLVEFDVVQAKSFSKAITSQVDLATLELATEIRVSDYVRGNILLEKQDSPATLFDVTEAFAEYGNSEKQIVNFRIGKMVIPFGKYETSLFSDPLGLSLGETHKNVVMGGIEWNGLVTSMYIFKGTTKERGKDDRLREFGAELGYLVENDNWAAHTSINYLSNFADTDLLSEKVSSTTLQKEISGYALNLITRFLNTSFVAEYISASKAFDSADLMWKSKGARPSALQLEVSYTAAWKHETTFSLGYQSTKESVGLGLSEDRLLFGTNSLVNEHTSVGLEHFIENDYATNECSGTTCGTGNKGYTSTVRFSLIF